MRTVTAATETGLGDVLFTKTQRQVLGLLFGNPERSFYAKEIVRFAGVGIGSVQRELEKLSVAGLLTVTRIGNQKHYQANCQAPIFEELRGIVLKTFGLADALREALAEDNAFLSKVVDQPKIFLIGAEDDIQKPGK